MTAGNPSEGDTPSVDRKAVLIAFKQKVSKYTVTPGVNGAADKREKGARIEVDGNAILYYPEKLIGYFNIPTYSGGAVGLGTPESTKTTKRKGYTRTFYKSIDDASPITVTVAEHDVQVGLRTGKARVKSVTVPTGKVTTKQTKRSVAFAFPGHFTIPMIAQALGSMLNAAPADRKPIYFKTKAGAQYIIPYNTATDKLANRESGAWVATAPIAESNLDNPDNIPQGTQKVTGTGGDRDKAKAGS